MIFFSTAPLQLISRGAGLYFIYGHALVISLPSGFLQVENPLTVAGLLQSLGLGKYNIIFRAEEVSWRPLSCFNIITIRIISS